MKSPYKKFDYKATIEELRRDYLELSDNPARPFNNTDISGMFYNLMKCDRYEEIPETIKYKVLHKILNP